MSQRHTIDIYDSIPQDIALELPIFSVPTPAHSSLREDEVLASKKEEQSTTNLVENK